jgi:peptidoglycan lytic transglycosylase
VTRFLHVKLAYVLWTSATLALLAAPALAAGSITGGTAAPDDPPSAPPPPAATPSTPVAQQAAITLKANRAALMGRNQRISGSVPRRYKGRSVMIQRQEGTGWRKLTTARVGSDGGFQTTWRPDRSGRFTLRAKFEVAPRAMASAGDSAQAQVTVYRPAIATWFGPGFYGSRTACGQVLTTTLVGVAHRTLPCGMKVEFLYRGRTLVVPIVDRGPYANGADWDLTTGASKALGFDTTDRVGTITVARA